MINQGSLTLGESLHAPAHARAWVTTVTGALPPDCRDDLLLVVSELVTNAVRHGRGAVVLSLHQSTARVRVEVSDDSDRLPQVPLMQPGGDRSSGRGLLIVAATARDWGVVSNPATAGKTVWAEIALA